MDQEGYDRLYEEMFFKQWFAPRQPQQQSPHGDPVGEVIVIGAGVVGLTTALAVRSAVGCRVSVVASSYDDIVSHVAAAFWFPFKMEEKGRGADMAASTYSLLHQWILAAVNRSHGHPHDLTALLSHPHPSPIPPSPIMLLHAFTCAEDPAHDFSAFLPPYVLLRRPIPPHLLPSPKWQSGLSWLSFLTQSNLYMPMLRRLCAHNGVRMRLQKVDDAAAFARQHPNATIICCAGLGAIDLLGDTEMYPLQGTVVRVNHPPHSSAPWHGHMIDGLHRDEDSRSELAYIIPRSDGLVLGGTVVPNVWSTGVDPAVVEGIRQRCESIHPETKNCHVQTAYTGLRPARPQIAFGVRAGMPAGVTWIDSYGYGGAGWTVHLGAALQVVDLLLGPKSNM